MNKTNQIPVRWQADADTVDRLLGTIGRPVLSRLLDWTQVAVEDKKWPLEKITIQHYQDSEEDWEYLLLIMDFDCDRQRAKELFWDEYLGICVDAMSKELEGTEKEVLLRKIHFEFESNP